MAGLVPGMGTRAMQFTAKLVWMARHLIELVEHHIGVLSALHVHDDAHTFAVRLVIDVGDASTLPSLASWAIDFTRSLVFVP